MPKPLFKRYKPKTDLTGLDHIIIGSGVSGLTAALWLSRRGKKVAVLEQHYIPGGFTHSFSRKKGFKWDVGVHYVGNVDKENPMRWLFNYLTNKKLDWEYMGDVYDVLYIGEDEYKFRAGRDAFRKQLIEYFPDEENTIDQYLDLIDKCSKRANLFFFEKVFKPILQHTLGKVIRKRFYKYSQQTTKEVLESITDNQRLIAVLCAQCGNYGLSPKYSSFAAHALVINHFIDGGYYPVGGAEQIANYTIEHIIEQGGQVYVNANVDEIVVKNNKVEGIKIQDRFIPCKSVISTIGIKNTFQDLLPNQQLKTQQKVNKAEYSTGHMCLYVGLDKSSEELNLPKNNTWFFKTDDYDKMRENISLEKAPQEFAYISFPSAKDPDWEKTNPGTSTIQALSIGHHEWFETYKDQPCMKREEAYQKLKKHFEEGMLETLYKLYPQIKGHVVLTEVSSPLSTEHYSKYKKGEIYGLAHTPERFNFEELRPESKIKGLRLAGQDITIVGVAGAMLSGILCSTTILKWNSWKCFKEMGQFK
tara:strand:+ start:18759 stop:20351 length:1593 start_codon:yes stop_codon:yes gene_type:complete